MKNRPVIVHDLEDARAAVATAAELGLATLTLRSAPDAARYLGATVYRDIVHAACHAYPDVAVTAVFDCGADPGLALGALRHGLKVVRLSVAGEVRERIADIAAQSGAHLDESDADQRALDLLDAEDRGAALKAWLTAAD
jgi:S-adenosylmethionine/arginine decarboxylase-like enzyme